MSGFSSMQYTIGTALDRASERGYVVELLVDHHWVTGTVVANDGCGVVLDNDGREHCVVRLERISAVRVAAGAPMLSKAAAGRGSDEDRIFESPMPMPAPRTPSY
jgi:hypothetical protein